MILITPAGLVGMLLRKRRIVSLASMGLLLLLIWGKVAGDLFGIGAPDTAVFLVQFMAILFFWEASSIALIFDSAFKELGPKLDDISVAIRIRVSDWARLQLVALAQLSLAAIGLSLGLLVLGSTVSVSINQLGFTAILVLAYVVAILFLLTNRREPGSPLKRVE